MQSTFLFRIECKQKHNENVIFANLNAQELKRVGKKEFKKIGILTLFGVFSLTLFFAYHIPSTELNYNFEEFFPEHDEETDYYYNHRALFESDNDFILLTIANQPTIFDQEFLTNIHNFCGKIDQLENVEFTRCITTEQEVFIYPGGTISTKPLMDSLFANLYADSISIYSKKELLNTLINPDASALLIFVRHQDLLSKAKSDELVDQLKQLATDFNFPHMRMAGRSVGQRFYVDTMTVEMGTYIALSMVFVVLFLLVAFRSSWGLLIPQVVIIGSMIWIVGFMAFVGEPINIILTILPSIMFVVAMSDVIHLVSKYFELLREGREKFEAIKTSFREIGMATFLTSLTTAIGFFSLLFVNVQPIKVFGLYVGIGVLMAFVLTFTTLPVLFFFTTPPKIVNNDQHNFWGPIMRNAYRFTLKNRKTLPFVFIAVILTLFIGVSKMESNNYLMDDLKSSNPMKQDFDYMDQEFGGVRPFEMAVELADTSKSFWDTDILAQLDALEDYISEVYGAHIKLSLIQTIRIVNRSSHLNDPEYFRLPETKSRVKSLKRLIKVAEGGKFYRLMVDSTELVTRINGTLPDCGRNSMALRNQQLHSFLAEQIDSTQLTVKLTGAAHLLDKNMSYMSGSLVSGLIFAILIVAIIMGVLFKSLRMVIISLIPNFIPLLVIGAIMGYFGINLKITTAIVFTISFGIAVDDTIHFLTKFNLELRKGYSVPYALKRTMISTGKAIVLTSAILCSGFMMLLFSDFLGTFYMGLMISITLIFAVLADLFLLPILILFFYRNATYPKQKT